MRNNKINPWYVSQKIALGFCFGAFAFMVFGSVFIGVRFMTAFIRGVEGALVFGFLAWASSLYLLKKVEVESEMEEESISES